jgi:Domain of unknown function (DUF5060)/Bacterial Ig-like domain/Putative collagen-binding domain of a collagenase
MRYLNTFAVLFTLGSAVAADPAVAVTGELKQWHEVLLTIDGPSSSQEATPNPFLDYRFNVTFTAPSGKTYVVPGYFAGDGAGGAAGNVWAAHLNPHEIGAWSWSTSFRSGTDVSVNLATNAGTVVAPYDGISGNFTIAASDKTGADFRAADKGMLVNRGQHYLTYGGSGKPFLFTGPGIPENILGYRGFTNTTVGIGHVFDAHLAHWRSGDPDWNSGAGKKLIGALNYIADNGANCLYMMSTTVDGDGNDCFPHPSARGENTRYDLLKLRQWDIALAHAQRKGIFLHWALAENENHAYYGGSNTANSLTTARKLYFRMLIARFGHYNGLKWNLAEEIEWIKAERLAQAAYLKAIDPYDHPITHQGGGAGLPYSTYDEEKGTGDIDAMSFQGGDSRERMFDTIKQYREMSAAAGQKWTAAFDEPQKIENNTKVDVGYPHGRRDKMWPCLMAGGDGFMWYIQQDGGGHGFDQRIDDFSIMRDAFRWSGYIRDFLSPLPLTAMTPSRTIVTSTTGEDACLYQAGEVYAVFNDRAGTGMTLDLTGVSTASSFTVRWFDPRNGGALQTGTVATISGGAARSLGNAPAEQAQDWAVLVQRINGSPVNVAPNVSAGPDRNVTLPATASLDGTVTDDGLPTGGSLTQGWSKVSGPGTVTFGTASAVDTTATFSSAGVYVLRLSASDTLLSASDDVQVTVLAEGSPFITASLINADTDLPIAGFDPLANGAVLNLAQLPTRNLAVRANVNGTVGSVRMILSGAEARTQTEGVAPYSLHGDTNGDFAAWTPVLGSYGLNATAYSATQAGGTVLGTQSIAFSVIDQGTPVNAAPTVSAGLDQSITLPATATLAGTATDDGLPAASTLTTTWSKVSGPGTVTFGNAGQLNTSVTFSLSGTYVLRLTASDGTLSSQDDLSVTVTAAGVPPTPPTTPASPTIAGNGTATPTLSGTTQPGAVIHILVDGIEVGTTTAAGDGTWSYTITTGVTAGSHTITVTASNAGGASPASPAVTVTVAASGGSGSGSSSGGGGGSSGCGLGGVAAAIALGMLALCGLRPNKSQH